MDKNNKKTSWRDRVLQKNRSSTKILKSRVGFKKTSTDAIVESLTETIGTLWFLIESALFIFGWVFINARILPGIQAFDPYPYPLLMMIVQFFAIFLTITILISQNRQARIAEVHQRMDLEINVRAEHEITKILHMMEALHLKQGISKDDHELDQMLEKTDILEIKEVVEKIIEGEKSVIENEAD